jgi:hypothetical protein
MTERGVWVAPYTTDGCPVFVAITGTGDYLTSVVLRPGVRRADVIAMLRQRLDSFDPPGPTLRLLRD